MNKTRTNNEPPHYALLIVELQSLRKGSGLVVWKLQHLAVLRGIIARQLGVDADTLAVSQMHAYLLYELSELGEGDVAKAVRNAYAIGQEHDPHSLTHRRADLSLRLNRHPDTIKAYENEGISQLAHRLTTYAALPTSAKGHIPSTVKEKHVGLDSMEKALKKTVVEGLAGLYTLGGRGVEALRPFGRSKHPYLDTNIELVLSPSSRGDDWFLYKLRYMFRSTKSIFRIGIVTNAQDCGMLMSSGLFDEVTQLNQDADFDREIADIISSWRFIVHDKETGIQHPFWFTELDATIRRDLLTPVWQVDADVCRVIEVHIPEDLQGESISYELRCIYNLRVGERYAYWEAPGLMYLNTITIDVSQFPHREQRQFFIKPFLGTAFPGLLEPGGSKFTLPASSWLMLGHGIVIIWS